MRLGREFDALRVAFSLGTFFFGEAKESTSPAGRDPRFVFVFDFLKIFQMADMESVSHVLVHLNMPHTKKPTIRWAFTTCP